MAENKCQMPDFTPPVAKVVDFVWIISDISLKLWESTGCNPTLSLLNVNLFVGECSDSSSAVMVSETNMYVAFWSQQRR